MPGGRDLERHARAGGALRLGQDPGVTRRVLATVLPALVAVAAAVACSGGAPGPERASAATSTTAAGTETPPGPEVLVAGDSVAASLVPPLMAALGERAAVDYLAVPTISAASDRLAWRRGLDEHDPDLVVVLVGTWEVLQPEFAPTEPGWAATYRTEVLAPLLDAATVAGARVLWIEMHTVVSALNTLAEAVLAHQVREVAATRDDVDVVDSGTYVDRPGDVLADVLPGPDGIPERIRRLDGTGAHLCPPGLVRLTAPVLEWVVAHAGTPLQPVEGWQDAGWREADLSTRPEECPPAGALPDATP